MIQAVRIWTIGFISHTDGDSKRTFLWPGKLNFIVLLPGETQVNVPDQKIGVALWPGNSLLLSATKCTHYRFLL